MGKNAARAEIMCTIEAEYVAMIAYDKDPRVMWTKLADANKSKCTASLHTLQSRLLNLSMLEGETTGSYLNRSCNIESQISSAEKTVDVDDKKYALLNGL